MAAEKNFENRLKKWLQSEGIYPLGTPPDKMPTPPCGYYEKRFANRMTKSGLPDMHICVKGMAVETEVKAENGTPSDMQLFMIDQIRNSGGFAFVVFPSGFDKFKHFIKELKRDCFTTEDQEVILR